MVFTLFSPNHPNLTLPSKHTHEYSQFFPHNQAIVAFTWLARRAFLRTCVRMCVRVGAFCVAVTLFRAGCVKTIRARMLVEVNFELTVG